MTHRYADLLKPLFDRLILELRDCEYLHADETGWSMDGKRAYAWLFANDDFRVFLFRDSRGSKVPKEVLGLEKLMLILITDRYRGYLPLLVERQFCFVHLLRDVEKLKLEFPDETQVAEFCDDLIPLLQATIKLRQSHPDRKKYLKRAKEIQKKIMEICNFTSSDPGVQHIQDIFRLNEKNLFQWVKNPDIPCENNFAERNLRPIVISRKLSFGSQSERGMQTREILMTVLHFAKCRGHDSVKFLEQLLDTLTANPKADIPARLKLNTRHAVNAA
ncbi:MAG: transposase [Victivallaceae bacterium]